MAAAACWLGMALLAGCSVQSPAGDAIGPGKRPQRLALSPAQELEVGRRAYRETLDKVRDRILPADSSEVQLARRVSGRIVQAAGNRPLQKEINLQMREYHFEWEVNVVRDKQVNAFCLPGGKIVVYTGILQMLGDEAELAAVLAHEIAHALAHHSSERVAREQSGGGSGLSGLRYDREQESEADHIGLFLMTFAGYDPAAAVRFWERMAQHGGQGVPEFLSDHPSHTHRVTDLQRWLPQARAAKKAFDEGRVVAGN